MSNSPKVAEARQHPRLKLAPMYTLLRAKPAGESKYVWTGYIYDISISGMRFELDQPLEPGTEIEVRGMLPAGKHTTFRATGKIVRVHDDEPAHGPVRMAMHFDEFVREHEHQRLADYLANAGLRRAA